MPGHDAMKPSATKRALWAAAFRDRAVWLRALKLGFSVGCLQAAVNQGDLWLRHAVDGTVVAKTIISPLIGFTLVLISAAGTWVQKSLEQNS